MKLSNTQREVISFLRTVEKADIHEIYSRVTVSYYCNYEKHLGTVLSRMVKGGFITRIKPGVFKLGGNVSNKEPENINQSKLF